jgi:hypothetical protein
MNDGAEIHSTQWMMLQRPTPGHEWWRRYLLHTMNDGGRDLLHAMNDGAEIYSTPWKMEGEIYSTPW